MANGNKKSNDVTNKKYLKKCNPFFNFGFSFTGCYASM